MSGYCGRDVKELVRGAKPPPPTNKKNKKK
jgi:hypothetical protein